MGSAAGNPLDFPAADGYVVFLIDGLGWNLLQTHGAAAPYLASLAQNAAPITCGVPSTTVTSITSLGTGLPPGSHGIVGFTSRIPGTDQLLDALRWDAAVDPREWQPHDTVFMAAHQAGLPTTVVSKRAFEGSGLTVASQRGADYVGADTIGERISAVARASAARSSLTYVYEGELDATGHSKGSASWAWEHQLSMADSFAQRLRESLGAGVALVVTADHGMVDIAAEAQINVDDEPELLAGVQLMGGEARFRHLYCREGSADDVAATWRERLGDDGLVLTRDEAIDRGWFGAVELLVRPRLGDVMVASLGDCAVMSTSQFPHEAKLIGLHGSLSADEMLIPLLVDLPTR
jgi:predicted AlkP superfamily pyrophosphatase or phosphodiesterase